MTSGTILPSIGPSPPEFRRSFVPEHMRPKSLEMSAREQPAQGPLARPEQKPAPDSQSSSTQDDGQTGRQIPNTVVSLGGASAVAVQVQEDSARQQPSTAQPDNIGQAPELTDEELGEIQRLKERDREVRAHETAHASVGRGFTGTPSYEYTTGPDDVRYAVGGHVSIDVSEVPDDPEATIAKMEVVQAAALAPARPSGQDRAVAAAAAATAREAQAELAKNKKEEALAAAEEKGAGQVVNLANGLDENNSDIVGASIFESSDNAQATPQAVRIDAVNREPVGINLVV